MHWMYIEKKGHQAIIHTATEDYRANMQKIQSVTHTVKGIEHCRRSMSLDTYLGIVQALETTPAALMSREH